MILQIILWVMIILNVVGLITAPFMVGRPRQPLGPGWVLWAIIYSIIAISTYLYILFGVLK